MNKNNIYLALLRLLNIKCSCGEDLIIREVVDSNDRYLLLRAFEKRHLKDKDPKDYENFYVIYDIRSKKVISPGTFPKSSRKIVWPPRRRK